MTSTPACLVPVTCSFSLSTDFLLWMDSSGRVLPIRTSTTLALTMVPPSKPADGAIAAVTSEFQKFSPFVTLEEGAEPACQVGEAIESRPFLPHIRSTGGSTAPAGPPRPGPSAGAGPLDYGAYYVPAAEFYSTLAKEHSLESQDSSTLSSPPSDSLAPPGGPGPAGAPPPDSLFQFSIGKILEDEGGPGEQGPDCELSGFYDGVTYSSDASGPERGAATPPQLQQPSRAEADAPPPAEARQLRRWVRVSY